MHYIYIGFNNKTITVTREQPACGVCYRWKEERLTTKALEELQNKHPDKPIIISESVIGLIRENDKKAAMPITRGEKKPFDPNSNRLKFDLKKVGRKTYTDRETKPQQDHIARHRAPLPTDRDRAAAESSSSSTNFYVDFLLRNKSEILSNEEVREAIDRAILNLYYIEKGCFPTKAKLYDEALRKVFPKIFAEKEF